MGKIGSIFDDMHLLRICKITSVNFFTNFWHFFLSLSVSQNFKTPWIPFIWPFFYLKIAKFTKMMKNQQMLIFVKIPSTVLLIIKKSTTHFNFKENKQKFIILWHLKDNWWKKFSWFFDFFQFPKESLWNCNFNLSKNAILTFP